MLEYFSKLLIYCFFNLLFCRPSAKVPKGPQDMYDELLLGNPSLFLTIIGRLVNFNGTGNWLVGSKIVSILR